MAIGAVPKLSLNGQRYAAFPRPSGQIRMEGQQNSSGGKGMRRPIALAIAILALGFGLAACPPMSCALSYVLCVLPGIILMLGSAVPALAGAGLVVTALLSGRRWRAIGFAVGGVLAALSAVHLVRPFLLGQDASSSTAALIWVWAPVRSMEVLGLVSGLGWLVTWGERPRPRPASRFRAVATPLLWPVWVVLGVLIVGIVRYSFDGAAMAVAEHSSNPYALRHVFEQNRFGPHRRGVELFLAQNRSTPQDVRDELTIPFRPSW